MYKKASTTSDQDLTPTGVSALASDQERQGSPRSHLPVEMVECWAAACLSISGEVLYATPSAQEALAAICDPRLPRPIRRVDASLLERLRQGINDRQGPHTVTLLRRDGVISHYTALTKVCECPSRDTIGLLFLPPDDDVEDSIDKAWLPLLRALPAQESA